MTLEMMRYEISTDIEKITAYFNQLNDNTGTIKKCGIHSFKLCFLCMFFHKFCRGKLSFSQPKVYCISELM